MKKQKPQTRLGRPVNEQARHERMTQILDGARRCFVERGFHASSTAQISAAAGVSVANLYQYFPTKEALVAALIEVDLRRHSEMISRVWETDLSPQGIKQALEDIFLTKEGHDVAILRAEIASEGSRNAEVAEMLRRSEASLFELLRQSILAAQNAGRASPDLDPIRIGERLSLVFEGVMRLYVFSPSDGESLLDRYYGQLRETLGLP